MNNSQFCSSVHTFTDEIITMVFEKFDGMKVGGEGFAKEDVMKHLFGDYNPGDDVTLAKPKKSKKVKDPNKPKRALSGYTYFGQQNKDAFNEEMKEIVANGGEKPKYVSFVGQKWKELSEEKQQEWNEKAKNCQ